MARHTKITGQAVERIDQFGGSGKADPRLDRNRAFPVASTIAIWPGRQNPAEIEQRIADRRQFPIDKRGKLRPVMPVHDVGEVIVAVHDPGTERARTMAFQPGGDPIDHRQSSRRPAREVRVGRELRAPV